MSKKDIYRTFVIDQLTSFLSTVPLKHHFQVHHMFNLSRVNPQWRIETYRRNDDLHLLFVMGGKGKYLVDKEEESLLRGKVIFVSNQFPHAAFPYPSDLPGIIPVRFGLYDNSTMEPVKLLPIPFYFACTPVQTSAFQWKFEQLFKYFESSSSMPESKLACGAVLYEILIDLVNELIQQEKSVLDDRMVLAKRAMDERINRQISIENYAQQAGLSSKQFTRLFSACYGITPRQYVIQSVLRHARFMLEETTMSINEIAQELGYPNPYSFSKQYKNANGHWPTEARRRR